MKTLGIDASNIRGGGGVTHLVEFLRAANPEVHGFAKVVVWGGQATLSKITNRPWLFKSHLPVLDKSLAHRSFWQRFKLSKVAHQEGCDVLLVPGGSYAGSFHPIITMSRNLLPFEWRELRRFGWSWMTLKLSLLRFIQKRSFQRADGLIFLTQYARDVVMRVTRKIAGVMTIIPHGVDNRFLCHPGEQLPITHYSADRPFRILYVSIIDVYKHQWCVAEAVAKLRANGLPVVLDLVGPANPHALLRLQKTIRQVNFGSKFVHYCGAVPPGELQTRYAHANLCVFASSCENMPNILLEGMASGLPIACSNLGPMPEVLGDAGVYFNPEDAQDIARALQDLIQSPELRSRMAKLSFARTQVYSWQRCASETLGFLAEIVSKRASDFNNK
jgi:glycosyltransferase involved in cell wall biosynthesis